VNTQRGRIADEEEMEEKWQGGKKSADTTGDEATPFDFVAAAEKTQTVLDQRGKLE